MKKIFWAMSFVFFFGSLSQATTNWSGIDLSALPSATVVTISQDFNFQPSSDNAYIGSLGGPNSKESIDCYLQLNAPFPNGLILKGPVNFASFSAYRHPTDQWGGTEYVLTAKSNKPAVRGISCLAGNRIGGASVADFASIVSQIGTIALPPPDHQ